jgi:hypothetical protein
VEPGLDGAPLVEDDLIEDESPLIVEEMIDFNHFDLIGQHVFWDDDGKYQRVQQ